MPTVKKGKKVMHFPYTKEGMAAAKKVAMPQKPAKMKKGKKC